MWGACGQMQRRERESCLFLSYLPAQVVPGHNQSASEQTSKQAGKV